jgi:hypothetical protein
LSVGLAVSFLFAAATGCDRGGKQAVEREESNLKPLALLYGQYISKHQGKRPANKDEFVKYLQGNPELVKRFAKDTPIEQLFVSSRDKKEYVVAYGPGRQGVNPSQDVIAYEQEGLEGKRWIATSVGEVREVDEAKFQELKPDAAKAK